MHQWKSQNGWSPLLTGDARELALHTVQSIARTLGDDLPPSAIECAFRALFFGELVALPAIGEAYRERACAALERAIALSEEHPASPWLHAGYPGVAWVTDRLRGRLWEADDDDPNAGADRAVSDAVATVAAEGEFDVMFGLVGLAVYALDRLPYAPRMADVVADVVRHLARLSEGDGRGRTWRSPKKRSDFTCMFGVAHGVAGVLPILADAVALGIEAPLAAELLEGAVEWLFARRMGAASPATFPAPVGTGVPSSPSWCHGDPGIAAALYVAGDVLGREAWKREGLVVAQKSAKLPLDKADVGDASLCHGAAGNGHLFHRLACASGDEGLRKIAQRWYERAFTMRRPGEGAPFRFLFSERGSSIEDWREDGGLLTGNVGVGLCLLSAIADREPTWDRFLLLRGRNAQ